MVLLRFYKCSLDLKQTFGYSGTNMFLIFNVYISFMTCKSQVIKERNVKIQYPLPQSGLEYLLLTTNSKLSMARLKIELRFHLIKKSVKSFVMKILDC